MFAKHTPTIKKPQLWPHNHLDPHFVSHMPKFQDISWDKLVAREENPPTSSNEGAAQLWASAVVDAVQKMEKRRVRLGTSESSGMPPRLHLNYEEDFLNYRSHQVPGVFTDPLFLPNMVNSVYKLVRPPVLAKAPPFTAANDCPTTPVESVDDTVTPSPSLSTAGIPAAEKGRAGLPATPV